MSTGLYQTRVVTRMLDLPAKEIGGDMRLKLEQTLQRQHEGKCILDGFVRVGSLHVLEHSVGVIEQGSGAIRFRVKFHCDVMFPANNMPLRMTIKNKTKLGLHGALANHGVPNPLDILVPRDHYVNDPRYQAAEAGAEMDVIVIGSRFQAGDAQIMVLAKLADLLDAEQDTTADAAVAAAMDAAPADGSPDVKSFTLDMSAGPTGDAPPKRRLTKRAAAAAAPPSDVVVQEAKE